MRKKIFLGAVVALFPLNAKADLTLAQWAKGPKDGRAIYTAGALEAAGVYAEVLGFVEKWEACLKRLKLTYGEVGEEALEYGKRKGLEDQPAPAVMIAYVNERCGFVPLTKK